MKHIIYKLQRFFSSPQLEREAFEAYLNRLPESIEVSWNRDGEYIIGRITEGGKTYLTQAKSGNEFVDMVNDAVYTMHNIPEEYRDAVETFQAYKPSQEALMKLEDAGISSSQLSVQKKVQTA